MLWAGILTGTVLNIMLMLMSLMDIGLQAVRTMPWSWGAPHAHPWPAVDVQPGIWWLTGCV